MTTEQDRRLEWTSLDAGSAEAWAELTNLLAVVDGTEDFYTAQALAEELGESGTDPRLDTVAVRDGRQLVAYGQVRVRRGLDHGRAKAFLGGGVHPDHRGQGIGRQLMDRLERRALELSAERHPGLDVCLGASGGLAGAPVRPLLEHRGYAAVRYFTGMNRPLPGEPLADPSDRVESRRVEPYQADFGARLLAAHNDAFSTHFGFTPHSPQEWADGLASSTFRPDCSVVVRSAAGAIEAYVMAYRYIDDQLYIGRVGTVPAARGRGLARACLLATLRAGIAAGYRSAALDVDSQNPTGAGALYESVGFRACKTYAAYDKVVSAGG